MEYSARELAESAGTTVRTVHYYTAEGLLPPPLGSRRDAVYTDGHLARLRIISALRDEGLALNRIRERLAPLTDQQVLRVAEILERHLQSDEPAPITTLGLIDLEVSRHTTMQQPFVALRREPEQGMPAPLAMPAMQPSAPAPPRAEASDAAHRGSAREYLDRLLRKPQTGGEPAPRPKPIEPSQGDRPEIWYEYRVDDGISLRIRDDRYREAKGRPAAIVDTVRAALRRYSLIRDVSDEPDDPGRHP